MINKSGYKILKKAISTKDLNTFEKDYAKFIYLYCKNKNKKISKKFNSILKKNGNKFRKDFLLALIDIEKKNKKLFYNLSKDFSYSFIFDKITNNEKVRRVIKNYFGKGFSLVQKRNPVMLFNKKKLERLKYEWHQESQFYPNHEFGLHLWFPLFRSIKTENDGGMKFAKGSNYKNYPYVETLKKNGWRQRVPKIDVEKTFKVVNIGLKRGDVVFFENKLLHKSDDQQNDLPRVAFVIRFISNGINNSFSVIQN
jgi:hypothetical protein